jgi:demethylmenaquinone methyltransferase/2-methoxy-6-polyprenyl-1,4-benzoquinol methylase
MDQRLLRGKKSKLVQDMFNSIADSYDTGNNLITFGLHNKWKQKLVRISGAGINTRVLDCATGTGDLAFMFSKKGAIVIGCDFSEKMLKVAKSKNRSNSIKFETQDVTQLTYSDNTFDICTISYGIRNVENVETALSEMARVVRSGGRLLILETGVPENPVMKAGYRLHTKLLMPTVGAIAGGNKEAYDYLSASSSDFPSGRKFVGLMNRTKLFSAVQALPLMGGSSYIYIGYVK